MIKKIVADAGLLLPEAGTVDLEKFFPVDLWVAHDDQEAMHVEALGWEWLPSSNRGRDVGLALDKFPDVKKDEVLFLSRRVNFISTFTAGAGTTCGEWTRPVDSQGRKGFFKASASLGVCPVRCDFCYLRGVPFGSNSIALNVGEYAAQVARPRKIRNRAVVPSVVNLSETGGLIEWATEYGLQGLVQAYTDATLAAGSVPYWLTKRPIAGVNFAGAHVGISLNPWAVMSARSPGAGCPNDLLAFLYNVRDQGASTVIRWGPIVPGYEREYDKLARKVWDWGFEDGRFTVDLLRYSKRHPEMRTRNVQHVGGGEVLSVDQIGPSEMGFEFRAHKFQETPETQRIHLERIKSYFPDAHITVCKMQPSIATEWIRAGLIKSFPCACWQ